MTTQQREQQGFWRNIFRRDGRQAAAPEVPTREGAREDVAASAEAPQIEITPNDPILAYLASVSGVVEVDRIDLDSPALRAMKAADVKVVVPLVSQGELIGLLNLGP